MTIWQPPSSGYRFKLEPVSVVLLEHSGAEGKRREERKRGEEERRREEEERRGREEQ